MVSKTCIDERYRCLSHLVGLLTRDDDGVEHENSREVVKREDREGGGRLKLGSDGLARPRNQLSTLRPQYRTENDIITGGTWIIVVIVAGGIFHVDDMF